MQYQTITRSAAATAATVLGAAAAVAKDKPALDKAALDKAFEALKTFDWGGSDNKVREVLGPIEDAIPVTCGDAAARKELETRLAAMLPTGVSARPKITFAASW